MPLHLPHIRDVTLIEKIASGGMADVYRGTFKAGEGFERDVAVKILRNSELADSERDILSKLVHPNIAQTFAAGKTESGQPYFVMEFVDGISLREFIEILEISKLSIPAEIASWIIEQICDAMEYAHRLGILHCDLSPHNVLLSKDGKVKLVDFGIAKIITGKNEQTITEIFRGKAAYVAPEIAKGQAFGRESDIFSIGVIFFELLTGKKLFGASNSLATIEQVRSFSTKHIQSDLDPLPMPYKGILEEMLSENPTTRSITAHEIRKQIAGHTSTNIEATQFIQLSLTRRTTRQDTVTLRKSAVMQSPRSNFSNKLKIILVTSGLIAAVGATLYTQKSNSVSQSEAPKLLWEHDNVLKDISPPPPKYDAAIIQRNSTTLLNSTCGFLLGTLSYTLRTFLFSDDIEKGLKEFEKYTFSNQLKLFQAQILAIEESKNFCVSREAILIRAMAIKIAPRIAKGLEGTISSKPKDFVLQLQQEFNANTLSYAKLEYDRLQTIRDPKLERNSSKIEIADTTPKLGFMLATLPSDLSISSMNDCARIGEQLFANQIVNSFSVANLYTFPASFKVLILPAAHHWSIEGTQGQGTIVSMPKSSTVFTSGICFYSRENNRAKTVNYWVPSQK